MRSGKACYFAIALSLNAIVVTRNKKQDKIVEKNVFYNIEKTRGVFNEKS